MQKRRSGSGPAAGGAPYDNPVGDKGRLTPRVRPGNIEAAERQRRRAEGHTPQTPKGHASDRKLGRKPPVR